MSADKPAYPVALVAAAAPLRAKASNYPEPFSSRMLKRRQASARRPVRPDEFRRQPDPARARRRVGAAPRPRQAGRVRLHPRRPADARHRRRPHGRSSPACARASRPEPATRTISSTKRTRTSSISRSATARPATRATYPDDDLVAVCVDGQLALRPTRTGRPTDDPAAPRRSELAAQQQRQIVAEHPQVAALAVPFPMSPPPRPEGRDLGFESSPIAA